MWQEQADETVESLTSISALSEKIQQEWTAVAETALLESNPAYKQLVIEVEHCKAAIVGGALDGPFRDAQYDPEYIGARQAAQDALDDCDRQLKSSWPTH